jgi:hypothetical protein
MEPAQAEKINIYIHKQPDETDSLAKCSSFFGIKVRSKAIIFTQKIIGIIIMNIGGRILGKMN